MIFFGEHSLRTAVRAYLSHDHGDRNHQGLNNRTLHPEPDLVPCTGPVQCRQRLGRLLRYYHREAA
jgi:hypothetical protein